MNPVGGGLPLAASEFVHTALIVDSDEAVCERLVPTLSRTLATGEPILMVVGEHTERVVRATLGAEAARLEWGDPHAFYQRLGFAYETFRRYLAAQHEAGRRVHVVAEPDVTTDTGTHQPVDRVAAYLSYESICNDVYAAYGCPVICLWDSRRHPTLVIEGVRSLHNHELTAAGPSLNPDYVAPTDYLAGRNEIVLEPPPSAVDLDLRLLDLPDLTPLRALLTAWASDHDFAAAAVRDVVTATAEIATNGLVHGAPPVRIRGWRHSDTLIVQVDDGGGIPLPPTAGYLPPDGTINAPRGLWVARQLADAVTSHTSNSHTTVRLHFPYDVTHRNPDGSSGS